MNDAFDFVDLLSIDKLSEQKLYSLLEKFKTPGTIKKADTTTLDSIVGKEIAYLIKSLKADKNIKKKYGIIEKLNIKVVPYHSSSYPGWLKNISHFPPILFVRGNIEPEDEIAIAVIGTRGATVYGKGIAENFAGEFAQSGVTVVSGMARGVDTAGHWGALKSKGRTIAVLGCGVDICYPPENKELMNEIVKNGAAVSEFNIGTPPRAQNFPRRNRIVSGLSKAVVAIEAKEKSGVMNTVNWALNQNKDVFAIPGNIYSKASSGTNRLIKEGAVPVTSASEVLEYLGVQYTKKERGVKQITLTEPEKPIWEKLSFEPIYLDVLSESLNQPTGSILNILLGLEMKGLVKQLPGMMFVKNFE
jgi:DNA processing protein